MQPHALTVIRDEHQALAAMLRSMVLLLAQGRQQQQNPPFNVLRAMLLYVDEFPERLHHPKESDLLFPLLRERCPALSPTLDRLDTDHAQGAAAVRALEHLLLAWEVMGEPRRAAFEQALTHFVDGYLAHMAAEETEVLSAARSHLDAADWARLDAAFATNCDPLTGHAAADDYRPLFQQILMRAPAPIGLG
jgi:hemerythrin-like domain-containing protein